ncbi:MAG: 4-(cytidine 5'-diphospho)-2-C-methyl-D-erythritol kinase [bacterium]
MPIEIKTLTLSAPAKINLFLRVLQRREDGYHNLQTAFQFVSLADQITFQKIEKKGIVRNYVLEGVSEDDDLVIRAARLIFQASGCSAGVKITLQKNIPSGAGLGGGSSDAATVLLGLNKMFDLGFSDVELQQMGLQLGADVPVFVGGRACWAEGVGEQLTVMDFPKKRFLLLYPQKNVKTSEIFSHSRLTRRTNAIRMCASSLGGGQNDCEEVVLSEYSEVRRAYDLLHEFGQVKMSGTGSTLFIAIDNDRQAEEIAQRASGAGRIFVVDALNVSPIVNELN